MALTVVFAVSNAVPITTTAPSRTDPLAHVNLSSVLDAVYYIGLEQCEERWRHTLDWAKSHNITITPILGTRYSDINLFQPPIPIVNMPAKNKVVAGQVACTTSHIRAWRHAFEHNYSYIIVLEDDVRIKDALLQRLPQILQEADKGSRLRKDRPWHYVYLRLHPTMYINKLTDDRRWYGRLNIAMPSWGSAAYILSYHGIRYLLTRITAYSYPLDVQIERLQKGQNTQGAVFIALHACSFDSRGNPTPACPENIYELSARERGNCTFSATQSGERRIGAEMPGSIKT